MTSPDFPELAAVRRKNWCAFRSSAPNSSSVTLFHAYHISAMLCAASKFYRVMLIMAADGAMVCVTQLDGDNLMACNRMAQ
jgi:hypothetical protein